jgi:hypothetical protein
VKGQGANLGRGHTQGVRPDRGFGGSSQPGRPSSSSVAWHWAAGIVLLLSKGQKATRYRRPVKYKGKGWRARHRANTAVCKRVDGGGAGVSLPISVGSCGSQCCYRGVLRGVDMGINALQI